MKVRFRNTWFGPSEAYTIGKQTFRGQRYRKGQIYVLPDDYPIPSKGVEILEGESTYERPEDPRIELERLRKEREELEAAFKRVTGN